MIAINSNAQLAGLIDDQTVLSSGQKYNASAVGFGPRSKGFISWSKKHNVGNLTIKLPIVKK